MLKGQFYFWSFFIVITMALKINGTHFLSAVNYNFILIDVIQQKEKT